MAEIILLVFEGARIEPKIFDNIRDSIFGDKSKSIIHTIFGTHIYQLWNRIHDDSDLDLLEVIKEENANNLANIHNIKDIERDEISEIFLFFDYDGHVKQSDDKTIQKMLRLFDNETVFGKLYISYPMVESYKDISKGFQHRTVPSKTKINYKGLAAERTPYKDPRKIDSIAWKRIISKNMKKGNFIVTQYYKAPSIPPSQNTIFEGQLTNYIRPLDQVAVLSGIPFFIVEYFGGMPPNLEKEGS